MASRKSGRAGWLLSGLGFGIAGGVALGTLVLAPAMEAGSSNSASSEIAPGSSESDIAEPKKSEADEKAIEIADAQAEAADGVIADFASDAVGGSLDQRPVLILRTADADAADVEAVARFVEQAGAEDSGQITLTEKFFDKDQADGLKSIVANTLPAGAQLSEDKMAPGVHAGESLGAALMYDPETSEPIASVDDRALVLQTLREDGYIDYEDGTIRPAQGIILVSGDSDGAGEGSFAAKMLVDVATALDSRGNAVVLAGRIHSASDDGAIGILRADADGAGKVSTVDSVDRVWGQMATVLALREQIDGGSGSYGAAASAEASSPAPVAAE
ncbi:copper transporter [Corynebacterium breve]|uniref:Copper transporter n=1 Tax=Corynebacterium breve TaxID=3049799 RepID=A0ABY8VJH2_9CORY|nr:copper transporter [Corynebacterium breve]WIM68783.1 copper transporter [Corynebacterium breve]